MKLWEKDIPLDQWIEDFTVGKDREFDLLLAPYDIEASAAHAKMLCAIGVLSEAELEALLGGLDRIKTKIAEGTFVIAEGIEDVHSQIEYELTQNLGETGKKIHAGRSRNDQVLVALKLFFKNEIKTLHQSVLACIDSFLEMAERHQLHLMPGYTHSQIGMVSSFGLWFACFAEALVDDANHLAHIYKQINQNPLGSAAGYGNSFPLDRQMTTELLDFEALSVNVIYAQFTRGKTELWIGQGLASLGYTIGKFASDVCLYVSENYKFISLPDHLTTGSSIMPHKKNPDVFELIRAKSNQLLAISNQISLLTNNLMTGYHRDVQSLKEIIFPALVMSRQIVDMLTYCIPQILITEHLLDAERYDYLYSVEAVNKLVLEGVPFRDAYHKISGHIAEGTFKPDKSLQHNLIGGIHNISTALIRKKLIPLH